VVPIDCLLLDTVIHFLEAHVSSKSYNPAFEFDTNKLDELISVSSKGSLNIPSLEEYCQKAQKKFEQGTHSHEQS
jgi:hypothetical protein